MLVFRVFLCGYFAGLVCYAVSGCGLYDAGSGDAGLLDAGAQDAAQAFGIDDFAGIWAKATTGTALITANDCGNYSRLDFDYAYNQVTPQSESTLLLQHCTDADCTQVDSVTSTLIWEGDSAREEQNSQLQAAADCVIQSESSITMGLDDKDHGQMRWRGALIYVGGGCAPFIPAETPGDRCEALAETTLTRVD